MSFPSDPDEEPDVDELDEPVVLPDEPPAFVLPEAAPVVVEVLLVVVFEVFVFVVLLMVWLLMVVALVVTWELYVFDM